MNEVTRDMSSNDLIENQKAPRIQLADIENSIASEHYFTAADGRSGAIQNETYTGREVPAEDDKDLQLLSTLIFCVLILKNGFRVTGESACVSYENFSPYISRRIAREHAIEKMWPLMGYALKDRLSKS